MFRRIGLLITVAILAVASRMHGWRLKRVYAAEPDWTLSILLFVAILFGCILLLLKFFAH